MSTVEIRLSLADSKNLLQCPSVSLLVYDECAMRITFRRQL